MNFIKRHKWIAISVAVAAAVAAAVVFWVLPKQKFFELKCFYAAGESHYDFVIKDKNTAREFKQSFPTVAERLGTSVVCEDVREYLGGADARTFEIMSRRKNVASAFIHNPLGGINYQIEFMTMAGDVVGYSCIYTSIRYDCFTDEPFSACPQTQAQAGSELADKCETREIE
ncbi:MAG: hypothetical protein LBJ73_03595 [Rickettsiales bacterium]|jgi:hypothetical protein|nr:hypothetical protein [Rickettsiales bacterium]